VVPEVLLFLNLLRDYGVFHLGPSVTQLGHRLLNVKVLSMPLREQTQAVANPAFISEPVPVSSLPWWLISIVILGAALMAAGALIALLHPAILVSPRDQINGAVRVYAGYLVSRNLALAVMLLVALSRRAREPLRILVILTAFVQLLDAGLDGMEGRWTLVPGVLLFGIAFFTVAAWLSRYAATKR
jgi:hypothetical protein